MTKGNNNNNNNNQWNKQNTKSHQKMKKDIEKIIILARTELSV